jgi:hypothetical protein
MTLTPVKSQDPRVGYYVAGVDDYGNLIIQPFPKAGCGGTTGTFTIPHVSGVPVNAPAADEPNVVYDDVNNNLYIWDANPPPAKWVRISGGSSTGGGGSTGAVTPPTGIPIVVGKPTAPPTTGAGNIVYDETDGKLWIWDGTNWVDIFQAFTPNAPAAVGIGAARPATGTEGHAFFDTTNSQLYIWHNGAWVMAQAVTVPNSGDGVRFVSTLPPLPDPAYPAGSVVLNKADDKLWQNVAGVWTVIPVQANIAARSITAGQIATGTISASEVNTASLWSAMIAANQIQAGQIAAGAITGTQIAAGSLTADKFAANAITVGTAEIADASITTLKVAGEAINVIRQVNKQSVTQVAPNLEVVKLTVSFPYEAKCTINFSSSMLIHGKPHIEMVGTPTSAIGHLIDYGAFWITIDGVQQIGWYLRDQNAVSCERTLPAGSHDFALLLGPSCPTGQNIEIGNVSLVVHGAMR